MRTIETNKRITTGIMGFSEVYVKLSGTIKGLQGLLVTFQLVQPIAFCQPFFFRFSNRGSVQSSNECRHIGVAVTTLPGHGLEDSSFHGQRQFRIEVRGGKRVCYFVLEG